MEKITLNLGDILQLESEINGLVNPQNGEVIYEGFLKQKLSISLKFDLQDTAEELISQRKKIEALKDELILKYGEDDGKGGIFVSMYINVHDEQGNVTGKMINPKYVEFDEEYGQFLDKEIEIEYPVITKDDIKEAGKSKDDYRILFKLVKKGTL